MSALDQNPSTLNFLSPLKFKFQIKKTPNTNFFVQRVKVPMMSLPNTDQPNPFVRIPKPGDHITFEDLTVTFKVDENFTNYMELYDWIVQMGKPYDYSQYAQIENRPVISGLGIFSDLSLIVLDSASRANYDITFNDAFPITLGDMTFETTATDVDFVTAEVTFKYRQYSINKI